MLLTLQLPFISSDDLAYMIFPTALLVYYLICWLLVGRDPKIRNVATQYEAPPGISPALARYVLTGGSDGTTLAAILAELAAKDVITIQPEAGSYRIKLQNDKAVVMPEEAAVLKSLFHVELTIHSFVGETAKSAITLLPAKRSTPIFG